MMGGVQGCVGPPRADPAVGVLTRRTEQVTSAGAAESLPGAAVGFTSPCFLQVGLGPRLLLHGNSKITIRICGGKGNLRKLVSSRSL